MPKQIDILELKVSIIRKGITRSMIMKKLRMKGNLLTMALNGERLNALGRVAEFVESYKANRL